MSTQLPYILVPLSGLILPGVTMAYFFLKIEEEQLS
jgi:photosystem I reaction center subunit VIII